MNELADPARIRTAAEFVAALREVKARSGLTFRGIQHRASAAGSWLPASTLGTALNRDTLPRPELVSAFLSACGLPPEQIEPWLEVRWRLELRGRQPGPAAAEAPPTQAEEQADEQAENQAEKQAEKQEAPGIRERPRRPWRLALHAGVIALVLAAAEPSTGPRVTPDGGRLTTGKPAAVAEERDLLPGVVMLPEPGPYHIKVALSDRCLSELPGNDNGLIFQADCTQASPPMSLVSVGDGYRVHTDHRPYGVGCLRVTGASGTTGIVADGHCDRGEAEFWLEPAATPISGYRILVRHSGLCLSVPADALYDWIPLRQNPCDSGAAGQVFRFSGR